MLFNEVIFKINALVKIEVQTIFYRKPIVTLRGC
jgi:hypothetical protein